MALDKLKEMIARQEAIRRSRDRAWMFFAALLVAVFFLWILAFASFRTEPTSVAAVALYAGLALIATVFAARLLASARRLNRSLDEARRPETSVAAQSTHAADSTDSGDV